MTTLGIHVRPTLASVGDAQSESKSHRMPAVTRTASSSNLSPQLAIGKANSQSPLCGATEAKYLALCDGSTTDASMSERSAWRPGWSQKDCLPGSGSGGGPKDVEQCCPTYGPRAACGPRTDSVRPAKDNKKLQKL